VESLLTIEQVAEQLGKGAPWVYAQARRLGLPMLRVGRHLRVRQSELDAWLDGLRDNTK
jgi:excisionase family DNA binding protein